MNKRHDFNKLRKKRSVLTPGIQTLQVHGSKTKNISSQKSMLYQPPIHSKTQKTPNSGQEIPDVSHFRGKPALCLNQYRELFRQGVPRL